jgi:hypothetical protein
MLCGHMRRTLVSTRSACPPRVSSKDYVINWTPKNPRRSEGPPGISLGRSAPRRARVRGEADLGRLCPTGETCDGGSLGLRRINWRRFGRHH